MKYLNEERFIVNSNDKEARRKYNENYDRIFGEKQEPKHVDEGAIEHGEGDEIKMRLKMYTTQPVVNAVAQIDCSDKECCTGFYDDGVGPTACQNRDGCGLVGCPANDFGNTTDNPSVEPEYKCECCGTTVEDLHGSGCPRSTDE